MARAGKIIGLSIWVHRQLNGGGPVSGRNTCGDILGSINRNRESGSKRRRIFLVFEVEASVAPPALALMRDK